MKLVTVRFNIYPNDLQPCGEDAGGEAPFNAIRRLYDASGGIGVLGNGDKNMVI